MDTSAALPPSLASRAVGREQECRDAVAVVGYPRPRHVTYGPPRWCLVMRRRYQQVKDLPASNGVLVNVMERFQLLTARVVPTRPV